VAAARRNHFTSGKESPGPLGQDYVWTSAPVLTRWWPSNKFLSQYYPSYPGSFRTWSLPSTSFPIHHFPPVYHL